MSEEYFTVDELVRGLGPIKYDKLFCWDCFIQFNNQKTYDDHLDKVWHKINKHGIVCCNLFYDDAEMWVGHRKTDKHIYYRRKGMSYPTIMDTNQKVIDRRPPKNPYTVPYEKGDFYISEDL